MACRLNVTTQAVSKWETGAGFSDIQLISSFAKELDAIVDTLFGSHSKIQTLVCFNFGGEKEINEEYLAKGYTVAKIAISDDQIVAVLERDQFAPPYGEKL